MPNFSLSSVPSGLIFILLFISKIYSQEFSYQHYTVLDGLVQNQVITMFQDSKGYLWLGTKGGVSRFDGVNFRNYTLKDGLVSSQIIKILEDPDGTLYFCSYTGTCFLKKGIMKTLFLADTIPSEMNYMILNGNGSRFIIILNYNKIPVNIFPYDQFIPGFLAQNPDLVIQTMIKEENFNKYWIRSLQGNIYSLNRQSFTRFKSSSQKSTPLINGRGEIVIFDGGNVYKADTLANRMILDYGIPPEEDAVLFCFDRENNGYFDVNQQKVVVANHHTIETDNKTFNYINRIFIDRDDNLWVATENGFYRKISEAFENFTAETGANEYVWSIVEDHQRNIWFASYGDGLRIWDGRQFATVMGYQQFYKFMKGKYFYTGAIAASDHNLYFPVKDIGVIRYDGERFYPVPGLPKGSVMDVFEDTLNRRLLFGSVSGLIILDDFRIPKIFKAGFSQSSNHIKTIAQDKLGRYWLGNEFMLTIYNGEEFSSFPNDGSEYDHGAVTVFMDSHQNMWLGTTSGLYFYDYDAFRHVGEGIIDLQVSSLAERRNKELYMGVNNGLAVLDLESFYEDSLTLINLLDRSSGFLGFDCIRNGMLIDSEDNVWIAASDRVVKFRPELYECDSVPPVVYLEKIEIPGSDGHEKMTLDLLNYPDSLVELSHDQNNIRIDFHTVHFRAPEKIRFSYRLTGFKDDWSDLTGDRYVSYTNMAPGDYTFEVKALNGDGIWSEHHARALISVIPAIWQTLTFRLAVNFAILFCVVTILLAILKIRRKKQLRQAEAERFINELQLKTLRSQLDPHFTFNALNTIGSFIYSENKENAYRYFTRFSKLVRASLEASDKIARSLNEEIEFTRNYLELEKVRFRDGFYFSIEIDRQVDLEIPVPKMILQIHAENAVKHGLKHLEKDRKLSIRIGKTGGDLLLTIADNGIGRIKAGQLRNLNTGKGLAIMNTVFDLYFRLYKKRVVQQVVDLYDPEGNPAGTEVRLVIPGDNNTG